MGERHVTACPHCGAEPHEDGLRWQCGTTPWPGEPNTNQSWACAEIAHLRARVAELERDVSEAYQVVGVLASAGHWAECVRALDNLAAAVEGRTRPHDDLLPFFIERGEHRENAG